MPSFDEISYAIARLRLKRAISFDRLERRLTDLIIQNWSPITLQDNGPSMPRAFVGRRARGQLAILHTPDLSPIWLSTYRGKKAEGIWLGAKGIGHGSLFWAELALVDGRLKGFVDALMAPEQRDEALDRILRQPDERRIRLSPRGKAEPWRSLIGSPHAFEFDHPIEDFEPACEIMMLMFTRYGNHVRGRRPGLNPPLMLGQIPPYLLLWKEMLRLGDDGGLLSLLRQIENPQG